MKRRLVTFTLALTLLAVPHALASPLDITNILGQWQNAVGGPLTLSNNQSGQLTDQIRWGVDLTAQPFGSGYDFTPGANVFGVVIGVPFVLGTFTHHNQPIALGTEITAVEYALQFSTNGAPGLLNALLSFSHNETPNTPPPGSSCPPGTIGSSCADVVTIGAALLGGAITVGSDVYALTLLGFSPDGVTFSSSYISQEEGSNTTQLLAVVETVATPEPAGLLLLGSGLAAAAAAARRARRRRQATRLAEPPQD